MESLQELSTETIRKNWSSYKNILSKDDPFYELLWSDLYKKYEFEKNNEMEYIIIFRNFIEGKDIFSSTSVSENSSLSPLCLDKLIVNSTNNNYIKENDKTLIIKGMDGYDRKIIHKLCDKIGLHHNSVQKKKGKKHLYIYLPNNWSFEFTEKNPYSKEDEYYINLEKEHEKRKEKHDRWLSNLECYGCSCNGLESQMFRSVYIRNIYCEDCLETLSDGDGGMLNDHKFEPIN
jgi:hypothetical protein